MTSVIGRDGCDSSYDNVFRMESFVESESSRAGVSNPRLPRTRFRQAMRRGRADLRALDDRGPHLVRTRLGVLVGIARSRESV